MSRTWGASGTCRRHKRGAHLNGGWGKVSWRKGCASWCFQRYWKKLIHWLEGVGCYSMPLRPGMRAISSSLGVMGDVGLGDLRSWILITGKRLCLGSLCRVLAP